MCECVRVHSVYRRSLVTGKSNMCRSCSNRLKGITHKMSNTKLYQKWADMKRRCLTESDKRYGDYGGRGIVVCEEWMHFEPFMEWAIASGYADGLSIDRINNDGNYEPSNCRWATTREQSLNKRSTRYVYIHGRKITLQELSERTGMNKSSLDYRFDRGIRDEHILAPIERGTTVVSRQIRRNV